MLLRDIPDKRLNEMYDGEDYYWYLHSEQFQTVFLKPLASLINSFGEPCLDVGCGEGWLAEYVTVPYTGVEGSTVAVETARSRFPDREFFYGRIESPLKTLLGSQFRTIIFGGILDVLVNKENYVDFLELYLIFYPARFVIYDLERLDTSEIDRRFNLLEKFHGSVEVGGIPEVKRHRKVLVYSCT